MTSLSINTYAALPVIVPYQARFSKQLHLGLAFCGSFCFPLRGEDADLAVDAAGYGDRIICCIQRHGIRWSNDQVPVSFNKRLAGKVFIGWPQFGSDPLIVDKYSL